MSSNLSVYVGPYLVVPKVGIVVTHPARLECTSKQQHSCPPQASFCPQCGSPTTEIIDTVEQEVALVPYKISYVGDTFWTPEWCSIGDEHSLWLPNENGIGIYVEEDQPHEIKCDTINDERERFINKYGETITKLNAEFNTKVIVKYGIVTYWS